MQSGASLFPRIGDSGQLADPKKGADKLGELPDDLEPLKVPRFAPVELGLDLVPASGIKTTKLQPHTHRHDMATVTAATVSK
jgi:hypothetical protein